MVGNGSLSYDHDRDGRPTELGSCTALVRNLNHDSFLVVRYVRRRLTVSTAMRETPSLTTEGFRGSAATVTSPPLDPNQRRLAAPAVNEKGLHTRRFKSHCVCVCDPEPVTSPPCAPSFG
ncbi:UNVERIFIED_CONTAM: hypothetical protein FKN15_031923 [Acipenser sinensis]